MPNNAGDVGDDDHDQCPGSRPVGKLFLGKWILLEQTFPTNGLTKEQHQVCLTLTIQKLLAA